MTKEVDCSICKIPIDDNYCGKCGQMYSGENVSTISLIIDFFSNFFSVEKSGFATIFKIIQNPEPIVTNYYLGFKNYYASPGKILLYGIAAITIQLLFISNKVLGLSLDASNISAQYFFWALLLHVFFIISYLSFLPKKVAFSKTLIAIGYISTSLLIVFLLIFDLIKWIFEKDFGIYAFFTYVGFVFIWNTRVHVKVKKYWQFLIFTILQLILLTILLTLFIYYSKDLIIQQ